MMNTAKKWFLLNSGGGAQAFDSPAPLLVSALDTEGTTWAMKVGQDSYNWYLYESDGTTLVSQDLANSSNTKTWTGLTPDTTYITKCEAVSGTSKSSLLERSFTTCVTPQYAYYLSGLTYDATNDFGQTSGGFVNEIYSFIGTANTLTPAGAKSVLKSQDLFNFYNRLSAGMVISEGGYYNPAINFSLSDGSTFIYGVHKNGSAAITGVVLTVLSNSADANIYIRVNSGGMLVRAAGQAQVVILWPSTINLHATNTFVFKIVGTTFYASSDGGQTWGSASGYATPFVFDRVGHGSTTFLQEKIIFATGGELTTAQITRLTEIEKQSAITLKAIDSAPNPKGLTFGALSGDYIINSDFTPSVTGGTSWVSLLTRGDFDFVKLVKKYTAPDYGDDLIYVRKISTSQIAGPIVIPHPVANTDSHNTGSLAFINNTLIHVEFNQHYGPAAAHTKLVVTTWGIDWNFSELTVLPLGSNITSFIGSQMQYPQIEEGVDYLHIVCQEFDGTQARWITDLRSKDYFNSFDKTRILDSGGSNEWFYHKTFKMADGAIGVGINNLTNGAPDKYRWAGVLKSEDDFDTVKNLSESFSKSIHTDVVGMTLAEAKTNCTIDASYTTATNSIGIFSIEYDPTDDMIYGLAANGTDDGLNLFYWNGSSFTLVGVDVQSLDVIYGMTADGSQSVWHGTNNPFCVRTGGSNFDIFLQVNLGSSLWKITELATTDYGANCSVTGDITSDVTKNHHRIIHTNDLHRTGGSTAYNGNRTLVATREQTGTSDCFIKSI